MPALAAPTITAPSDLAWRVIGLVNLYRVLVSSSLLVMSRIPEMRAVFAVRHAVELPWVCAAWLAFGLVLIFVRRKYWPNDCVSGSRRIR